MNALRATYTTFLIAAALLGSTTVAAAATDALSTSTPIVRTLQYGARGSDVLTLQQRLISLQYLAPVNATGYFGPFTQAAVRRFQCKAIGICAGTRVQNGYGTVSTTTLSALALPSAPVPPTFAFLTSFLKEPDRIYLTQTSGIVWGYAFEDVIARISSAPATGFVPLYECHTAGATHNHFLSLSKECKGQLLDFKLGYIQAAQTLGTGPLYQYYRPDLGVYVVSSQPTSSFSGAPVTLDTLLGYVQ